jgi:hypothetical protein
MMLFRKFVILLIYILRYDTCYLRLYVTSVY